MNRIVVENVEAGYGSVRVLHGVSVHVDSGETVALLGTNGNGKSTLINCIMGIVEPTHRVDHPGNGRRRAKIDLVGRSPHRKWSSSASRSCPKVAASSRSSPWKRT